MDRVSHRLHASGCSCLSCSGFAALDNDTGSVHVEERDFAVKSAKWAGGSLGSFSGTVSWSAASTNYAGQSITFEGPLNGEFLTATRDAFNAWQAVANIKFNEVSDGPEVDIRLGFESIDVRNHKILILTALL